MSVHTVYVTPKKEIDLIQQRLNMAQEMETKHA
jgi:hypothetical protein